MAMAGIIGVTAVRQHVAQCTAAGFDRASVQRRRGQ